MMSLGDLANLGQIIGAIAVVVSLVYVALQIRQNTNLRFALPPPNLCMSILLTGTIRSPAMPCFRR